MSVAQPSVHWKRLFEPQAFPGWLTLGWKLVNALSNIDYLQQHLAGVWRFCQTPLGNILLIAVGLVWLAAVVFWPRKNEVEPSVLLPSPPVTPSTTAVSNADFLTNQAHEIAKIRLEQLADEAIMLVRLVPTRNSNQSTAAHLWSQFVARWRHDVIHNLQTYWGNDAVSYFASADGFNKYEPVGDIMDIAANPYRELLHSQKTLKELRRTLH